MQSLAVFRSAIESDASWSRVRIRGVKTVCVLMQGKWTAEEEASLKELLAARGERWVELGALLGRLPEAVRDKCRALKLGEAKRQGGWSAEEEGKLTTLVTRYLEERPAVRVSSSLVPQYLPSSHLFLAFSILSTSILASSISASSISLIASRMQAPQLLLLGSVLMQLPRILMTSCIQAHRHAKHRDLIPGPYLLIEVLH